MSRTALVITVGGNPEPVEHAIRRLRPDEILFVVSAESRPQAGEIIGRLDFQPQFDFIDLTDPENVETSFRQLFDALPAWQRRRGLDSDAVTVDITGGTKPMTAALALAGCESFHDFTYTGGTRQGAGIVISGTERPVHACNPWDALAIRECALAQRLLDGAHAGLAASVTAAAAQRATRCRPQLQVLSSLFELLARADRFEFTNLVRSLGPLNSALTLLGLDPAPLRTHWQSLEQEARPNAGQHPAMVLELIANADRRAAQHRFEDAVARLYRVNELILQDALQRLYPNAILGVLPLAPLAPKSLAQFEAQGCVKSKSGSSFILDASRCKSILLRCGQPNLQRIAERAEHLAGPLEARNHSILAHGLQVATQEHYLTLRSALLETFSIAEAAIPAWPRLDLAAAVRRAAL